MLRPDRQFGPHVVRNQCQQLRRSLRGLEREGIRYVFKLTSPEEVDAASIERQPLWNNRKTDHGPFDIVGDVQNGPAYELGLILVVPAVRRPGRGHQSGCFLVYGDRHNNASNWWFLGTSEWHPPFGV